MDVMLLIARVLLAGVFGIAGVAKLADRAGSRQALQEFGVPTILASPLGILLPLTELALAAALVPTASAWGGAIGALALLLLFVAGVGPTLAPGAPAGLPRLRPAPLRSVPGGRSTLVGDAALTAVAGFTT